MDFIVLLSSNYTSCKSSHHDVLMLSKMSRQDHFANWLSKFKYTSIQYLFFLQMKFKKSLLVYLKKLNKYLLMIHVTRGFDGFPRTRIGLQLFFPVTIYNNTLSSFFGHIEVFCEVTILSSYDTIYWLFFNL